MKVLVVDDDVVSRMVLMHLVDSCGAYEVFEAEDGEDAWNQLQQGLLPAICFCDLRMPRLSGMELLARVKAEPAYDAMRFVLASSAGDHATMATAGSLGADGYLVKPFARDQVLTQLSGLARPSAGEAENPLATMQRLGINGERLLVYLGGFESQLAAAGADIVPLVDGAAPAGPAEARARLERLHAGCVTLGLDGAAATLDPLSRGALDGGHVRRALATALEAVRRQAGRVRTMHGAGQE
jgi:two-component system chemotaxis response regulator CheY